MPGDLWTGYLQAQAADVAEVEREEGKKKQRLEEQLQKLDMESLRRRIDRDAQKWEIEKTAQAQTEAAFSRLREILPQEYIDAALTGIDLSGLHPKKEQEPWFIGTPHEEKGLGKEFHIKPGGSTRSPTDAERAERYSKIPEDQRTEYQKRFLKKYFEGTRAGTDEWSPLEKDVGFRFGGSGGEETEVEPGSSDAIILEQQKQIKELLEKMSK